MAGRELMSLHELIIIETAVFLFFFFSFFVPWFDSKHD